MCCLNRRSGFARSTAPGLRLPFASHDAAQVGEGGLLFRMHEQHDLALRRVRLKMREHLGGAATVIGLEFFC